jgi:hypothetical protein
MIRNTPLPPEFADLDRFVRDWALGTEKDRFFKVLATPIEELRVFFDAMLPRAEAIIVYLDRFPLDDLPPDARILYDLLVTFVETAHPIELKWKSTDLEDTVPAEKLRFHGPSATSVWPATR